MDDAQPRTQALAVKNGRYVAGELADFVMLEKGPHDVDPDATKDVQVLRTVVAGRTMHPKEAA